MFPTLPSLLHLPKAGREWRLAWPTRNYGASRRGVALSFRLIPNPQGRPRVAVGLAHPELRGRCGRASFLFFPFLPKVDREWRLARPTRSCGASRGGTVLSFRLLPPSQGRPRVAVGSAHPELRGRLGGFVPFFPLPPEAGREWRSAWLTRNFGALRRGVAVCFATAAPVVQGALSRAAGCGAQLIQLREELTCERFFFHEPLVWLERR
jgi:hypothetical protein